MSVESKIRRRISLLLVLFIIGMVLSGVTAFPIETELALANKNINWFPPFMRDWLSEVYVAVKSSNASYPYLAYATDWLAFAHLVIAVAFIGPLKDPEKNIWVVQFGMISCILVFPLALIAGQIRQIPFYWRLIDCSFGFFGFIILYACYKNILKLVSLKKVI